jgi:acetyl-CoA synthetase
VQLAAYEYPRFVQFAETLPMTATGKVLRRELRTRG